MEAARKYMKVATQQHMCKLLSSKFENVEKEEITPFFVVMKMIREEVGKSNPQAYKMLIAVLRDYNPSLGNWHREQIKRYIEMILDDQPELVDYLVHILPPCIKLEDDDSPILKHSLHILNSDVYAECTAESPKEEVTCWSPCKSTKTKKENEPKFYNYTTPSVNAYVASKGVPSRILPASTQIATLSEARSLGPETWTLQLSNTQNGTATLRPVSPKGFIVTSSHQTNLKQMQPNSSIYIGPKFIFKSEDPNCLQRRLENQNSEKCSENTDTKCTTIKMTPHQYRKSKTTQEKLDRNVREVDAFILEDSEPEIVSGNSTANKHQPIDMKLFHKEVQPQETRHELQPGNTPVITIPSKNKERIKVNLVPSSVVTLGTSSSGAISMETKAKLVSKATGQPYGTIMKKMEQSKLADGKSESTNFVTGLGLPRNRYSFPYSQQLQFSDGQKQSIKVFPGVQAISPKINDKKVVVESHVCKQENSDITMQSSTDLGSMKYNPLTTYTTDSLQENKGSLVKEGLKSTSGFQQGNHIVGFSSQHLKALAHMAADGHSAAVTTVNVEPLNFNLKNELKVRPGAAALAEPDKAIKKLISQPICTFQQPVVVTSLSEKSVTCKEYETIGYLKSSIPDEMVTTPKEQPAEPQSLADVDVLLSQICGSQILAIDFSNHPQSQAVNQKEHAVKSEPESIPLDMSVKTFSEKNSARYTGDSTIVDLSVNLANKLETTVHEFGKFSRDEGETKRKIPKLSGDESLVQRQSKSMTLSQAGVDLKENQKVQLSLCLRNKRKKKY